MSDDRLLQRAAAFREAAARVSEAESRLSPGDWAAHYAYVSAVEDLMAEQRRGW
jgi:hypothetical protein